MKDYSIKLPIFGEVSPNFKRFIEKTAYTGTLRKYMTMYSKNRLKFIPFDKGVSEMKSYSISEKVLLNDTFHEEDVSKFASDFTRLASFATLCKLADKIKFDGLLMKMPDNYTKSSYVLVVTLTMEDEVSTTMVNDLFSGDK